MADATTRDRQLGEITTAIRSLAEVMRSSGLTNIDIELGDLSIKLSAGAVREIVSASSAALAPDAPTASPPEPPPPGLLITAPMIGTFYLSSAPGEAPFVRTGDRIEAGQTIGII